MSQKPDFVLRIEEEKAQLDEKLDKLTRFTFTEKFAELDEVMKELMVAQRAAMGMYSDILAKRLALLTKVPGTSA